MKWEEAKKRISDNITVGDNLNTKKAKCRFARAVSPFGYSVQIGRNRKRDLIDVPWDMLEKCWYELDRTGTYDCKVFEKLFPKERKTHSCYVHTVGKIFEKAGLAKSVGNKYRLIWSNE
jgi:hypothetical protein